MPGNQVADSMVNTVADKLQVRNTPWQLAALRGRLTTGAVRCWDCLHQSRRPSPARHPTPSPPCPLRSQEGFYQFNMTVSQLTDNALHTLNNLNGLTQIMQVRSPPPRPHQPIPAFPLRAGGGLHPPGSCQWCCSPGPASFHAFLCPLRWTTTLSTSSGSR